MEGLTETYEYDEYRERGREQDKAVNGVCCRSGAINRFRRLSKAILQHSDILKKLEALAL